MQLTHLTLCNFRCFGPKPVEIELCADEPTAFIGTNGAGKTAVLQALCRLFGTRAAERRITNDDFHVPTSPADGTEQSSEPLWIEARLSFSLDSNGTERGVPACFRQMNLAAEAKDETPFCRIRLTARQEEGRPNDGDVTEDICWIEPDTTIGGKVPLAVRRMIQTLYVPAVRDPSGQLRQAIQTFLAPLFKALERSTVEKAEGIWKDLLAQLRKAIGDVPGVTTIEQQLNRAWQHLQQFERVRDVQLQPFEAKVEAIFRQMGVIFGASAEAPHPYGPDRLSDGLRSLFYFALMETRFTVEQAARAGQHSGQFTFEDSAWPCLTLFAIEEPENHLAPHYLGRVMDLLHRLANTPGTQVMLTSQSPAIMSRIDPEAVRYVRAKSESAQAKSEGAQAKSEGAPVKALALPQKTSDQFKYIKEAVRAHPELYFANAVILGEGDSEAYVFDRIAQAKRRLMASTPLLARNQPLDHWLVTFAPLGGRHVNHFWRLLNDLDIPHVTLLDFDQERHQGGWHRIHYAIEELRKYRAQELLAGLTEQECASLPPRKCPDFDEQALAPWLARLEQQGVFYSTPLDLDFMMLQRFEGPYKSGCTEPKDRSMKKLVESVLKGRNLGGKSYENTPDAALFGWYERIFLGKNSKPASHRNALATMPDKDLLAGLPPVLNRLFAHHSFTPHASAPDNV